MKTVAIESPYKGDVERNLKYLDECILYCIKNGMTPYASHKMLTTALDDNQKCERTLGIVAGLHMSTRMDERIFFIDYGFSDGMLAARKEYDIRGLSYRVVKIRQKEEK